MKKIILILISVFYSLSGLGCEDINFYQTHSLINQLPINNQGAMNTCYAQALSTVYNLENARTKDEIIDRHWLAFVHKIDGLHWTPRNMDYSLLSLAWADLKKAGFCDISYVRQAIDGLKQDIKYSDDQLFYLLAQYFKVKNVLTTKTQSGFVWTMKQLLKKLNKRSAGEFEVPWRMNDISALLSPLRKQMHKKSFFTWMEKDLFKACIQNANTKPTGTLISTARGFEHNDMLAIVTESLLAQNKPVSVGFCSNVLKGKKDNITVTPRILKAASTNCSAHYVTLVGSRKSGQSCQYLVRNSYGTGFWATEDYSCHCRDKNSGIERECFKSESSNSNLQVLGCWIDRNRLLTNTYDLSYLRN